MAVPPALQQLHREVGHEAQVDDHADQCLAQVEQPRCSPGGQALALGHRPGTLQEGRRVTFGVAPCRSLPAAGCASCRAILCLSEPHLASARIPSAQQGCVWIIQ